MSTVLIFLNLAAKLYDDAAALLSRDIQSKMRCGPFPPIEIFSIHSSPALCHRAKSTKTKKAQAWDNPLADETTAASTSFDNPLFNKAPAPRNIITRKVCRTL